MKAGRADIRYRWMRRRAVQGIALAAGSVALFGSLSTGVASAATQSASSHVALAAVHPMAPPPLGWCKKATDGWVWIDLDTGKRWQCIQNILGQYILVELSSGPVGVCPGLKAASAAVVKPDAVVCG